MVQGSRFKGDTSRSTCTLNIPNRTSKQPSPKTQDSRLKTIQSGLGLLLRKDGTRLRVRSTSMLPALAPGDKVEILPLEAETLVIGDIAVVQVKDRFIVHRYLHGNGSQGIVVKGDRLRRADAPVDRKDVIGKVVSIERNGDVHTIGGPGDRLKGLISLAENTLARLKDMLFGRSYI